MTRMPRCLRAPIPAAATTTLFILALTAVPDALGQTAFVNFESPHVHPLEITPDGATLLAVNTADNRLELFDVTSGAPVASGSIAVGMDPVSVRARSATEAWVVNHLSDSVSIVDLPSQRVVRTVLTGDEPCDVVFAGSPQRAFVSVSQLDQIRVYDPANLSAAPTILTIQGKDPRALAVSADGARVYVAIFGSGNTTTAVRQQDVSSPAGPYGGVNPPPNSGAAFNPPIAAGLPAAPPVAQIVRRNAAGQWLDDNGRNWSQFVTWNLLDNDVAIINAQSLAVTNAQGMLTTVMGLAVRSDGTVTAVGTEATNEARFEPNIQGTFIRVRLGLFNPATPGSTQTADLNPHLNYAVHSIPPAQRDESIGDPRAIVWHPTSGRAYVAGMGSNNVIEIDAAGARMGRVEVGAGPTGLALSADGAALYVLNRFEASISVVSTVTNTETARVFFFDPTPSSVRLGRPFLYDTHATSGLGQVSCASCHIDGGTDFLAWDLGDPGGSMKTFDQTCRQPNCQDWHPMKGPMFTQSLKGIIGTEPLHWRGDRGELAQFSAAFTGLQGADIEPSAGEMLLFEDFVAGIAYPPNPNRNRDDGLPAGIAVTGGNGNPSNGQNIYTNQPTLGAVACASCHGPANGTGTNRTIDDPRLPLFPQPLKMAQLRGLYEKRGWNRASQQSVRGFGFNHQSEHDTLIALLNAGFNFPPGPPGQQQRRDVEAFMLCFGSGTHAGVGQQITFDGSNNNDAASLARLNVFIAQADLGRVGLVVRGRQGGLDRGYEYLGGGVYQSDRAAETISPAALLAGAGSGSELTYTLVSFGTQRRIGIDRDADGSFDRDEVESCGDPVNPQVTAVMRGDVNDNGVRDAADVPSFVAVVLSPSGASPRQACAAEINGDGATDGDDIASFVNCILAGGCS